MAKNLNILIRIIKILKISKILTENINIIFTDWWFGCYAVIPLFINFFIIFNIVLLMLMIIVIIVIIIIITIMTIIIQTI